MRTRAFTLLELLVVVGITALITFGISIAYVEGIVFDQRVRDGRADEARIRNLQGDISNLIRNAYITILPDDTASCFIGNSGEGDVTSSTGTATVLTLTTLGSRLPTRFVTTDEEDWEVLNERYGPQGGLAEISLSMSPVGQPSTNVGGLYVRTQRPADGDPTQGGNERQLDPDIVSIGFEFFDGLSWQPSWDTRNMSTRRLPSAIRITYQLDGEGEDRTFIVRLPHSDATPLNPVGEAE